MDNMNRSYRLRTMLGESQAEFAPRLGVSQATVARLDLGQAETGPQRMLLDQIEADLAAGRIGPEANESGLPRVALLEASEVPPCAEMDAAPPSAPPDSDKPSRGAAFLHGRS